MITDIDRAAEIIHNAKSLIALTGAGISTESGIPDFRSAEGLWQKYDPAEYGTIQAFHANPEKVWRMLFDMVDLARNARPNPGHTALSELEKMNILKCIITQNIDNLHQEAGSVNVIEYHGNVSRLECLQCGTRYGDGDMDIGTIASGRVPPRCTRCGVILKPTVIFFGETIPRDAMDRSNSAAQSADAVLVVGTSAVVYPAAGIPLIAKQNRAVIIEFNIEATDLTRYGTDIFIQGKSGTTLPEIVRRIKSS
ncbi:MAG: RNA polymerase subunit sigma [Spirochaetes bacterium RBG_13_51_14]|nr:MAG: RNA polymerase subunit sigma [Spirochaetes bacterium RBG_13_51_14]